MGTASIQWADERHADLLIGELTHRFYNSLQVISSLLSMAMREDETPDTILSKVDAIRERVAALSNLHRRLARSRDRCDVLENHCRDICLDLVRAFGREDLTPWLRMDDVVLLDGDERRLVYLVTELVTNAVKYSRRVDGGMIWVELKRFGTGEVELLVRDNGDVSLNTASIEAPRVASALAQSLGGDLTVRREAGFAACARFPVQRLAEDA